MKRAAVLGVGNTLLCDEGVGIHVLHHLEGLHPRSRNVDYVDAGTLGFTLAERIDGVHILIVIDAARLGMAAGTVRCMTGEEVDAFLRSGRSSVHEIGIADLLDAARVTGTLPARRALIGIEPALIDWGEHLSPEVAAAVPRAAQLASELLDRWQTDACTAEEYVA